MISRAQLGVQIDRLADTYGDKPFSDQRVQLIWEAVDGLEYSNVIQIVDGFIRSEHKAPLPSDFAKAAREFRSQNKRYVLGEIQPREIANCLDCGDSGFIRVEHRETGNVGSSPCHCDRGAQLIVAGKRMRSPTDFGPQYGEHWRNIYKKLPTYQGGDGA